MMMKMESRDRFDNFIHSRVSSSLSKKDLGMMRSEMRERERETKQVNERSSDPNVCSYFFSCFCVKINWIDTRYSSRYFSVSSEQVWQSFVN
jgi:hypothetical protein